jgi:hypothetical protein
MPNGFAERVPSSTSIFDYFEMHNQCWRVTKKLKGAFKLITGASFTK